MAIWPDQEDLETQADPEPLECAPRDLAIWATETIRSDRDDLGTPADLALWEYTPRDRLIWVTGRDPET